MVISYQDYGPFADLNDLRIRYDNKSNYKSKNRHVYVVEMSAGFCKVGVSRNPLSRINAINKSIAHTSVQSQRIFISRKTNSAFSIESKVLSSLKTLNGSEFVDASYEESVKAVMEATRES